MGDRRFMAPERIEENSAITINATSYGHSCIQATNNNAQNLGTSESEDCLFLNVFAPKNQSLPDSNTSVLVIIHGGGFVEGSAFEYREEGILRNLVSRGIIVVTLNYRLGAFGFLVDDATKTIGNFGILDQLEALRWVKREIRNFGGDPNRVTLSGGSAGSASASMLSMMHVADDLFHQVYLQSSSIYQPGFYAETGLQAVVEASRILAQANGCHVSCSLYDCMRNLTWQSIKEKMIPVTEPDHLEIVTRVPSDHRSTSRS